MNFKRGLKHELKKVVTPLRERRFPVLVEQAKSLNNWRKALVQLSVIRGMSQRRDR